MYLRVKSQQPGTPGTDVNLRYGAALSGSYVTYASPSIAPVYPDLSHLVTASTDIVKGTVTSNRATVSPDGTFITTDYQVQLSSVLRGNLQPGAIITVSVPGGFVAFDKPTGTNYASVRTPWFKKMSNGKQYFMFLEGFGGHIPGTIASLTQAPLRFETTGGPQGVFEITSSGVVTSNSGRLHDPMWQYINLPVTSFQSNVEAAISTGGI
jgi:hypothetical protein